MYIRTLSVVLGVYLLKQTGIFHLLHPFLVLATVSPDADRQQGIMASSSTALSASANIALSSGTCNSITHMCAVVLSGTGASYTDPDDTNNAQCVDITSRIICSPGEMFYEL